MVPSYVNGKVVGIKVFFSTQGLGYSFGFQPADVITSVGDSKLTNPATVSSLLSAFKESLPKKLAIGYTRRGKPGSIMVIVERANSTCGMFQKSTSPATP